jgi:NADPH2:quinone reductase
VGEIVSIGPPCGWTAVVERLKLEIGARVGSLPASTHCHGGYRDIGLYEQASLVPVPDEFTNEEGAAFWTALLTMGGAMEMGGFKAASPAGKRVLITAGGSGMGTLALKLAKHWGATTLATTRQSEKATRLANLADHVVVCADADSLAEGVKRATDGNGADLILDPVGSDFYPGLLAAVARSGDIVSYECISGKQANISIMEMMMKDVSVHGFTIFRVANNPMLLNQLVEMGMESSGAAPGIHKCFDVAAAPAALEAIWAI